MFTPQIKLCPVCEYNTTIPDKHIITVTHDQCEFKNLERFKKQLLKLNGGGQE